MGRYDGPHFDCDDDDVVSIWVAHTKFSAIPDEYFQYNIGGSDDEPWNTFSDNFGFGYYGDDFVESFFQPSKRKAALHDQLKFLSFSSSFIDDAVAAAKQRNLDKTTFVYLMYKFAYDPDETGIQSDDYLTFLGAFLFDKDAKPVEKWTG